jgi:outer membrane protein assembly factor BamB
LKPLKNKIVSITLVALLMLSISASTMLMPSVVSGATLIETKGFAYAFPQVNSLGATEYLNGWISPPMSRANTYYYNLTLIVTTPSGHNESILIAKSDVGAGVNTPYVCKEIGAYTLTLSWPGDETHAGCVSPPYTWTVQEEPVDRNPPGTALPLPEEYWQFPISSQYYSWYQISGGWYQSRSDASMAQFNPNTLGPNTPHIVWRKQVVPGGLIGGTGYAIEGTFSPNVENNVGLTNYVCAQGYLWYTTRDFTNNYTQTLINLHCLNMYTGEEIFSKDLDLPLATPSNDPNAFPPGRPSLFLELAGQEKGGTAVRQATVTGAFSLWVSGNGLREIDPLTGNTLYYRKDVSPTIYSNGVFYYAQSGNLTAWDTRTKSVIWTTPGLSPSYLYDDILVYSSKGYDGIIKTTTYNAKTGEMIANGTLNQYSVSLNQCVADGNIYYSCYDRRMYAVSLTTCKVVWASDEMSYPWGQAQAYGQSAAYGMVYSGMMDGRIYAWNTTTGDLVWSYYSGNASYSQFGTFPFWGNIVIADGKLYSATGEHTVPNPIPYGYELYCLNATTGELIWNYPSFCTYTHASVGFGNGIAAGMLFYQNMYDGNLYMFGKGQTATTVSAPDVACTVGTPMVIKGTVTDQSPGQTSQGIPQAGTPAVSDQDQSQWMQYLFNNAPRPTNATGVPVIISVIDSNGNYRQIGTTTSNDHGTFGFTWTPDISGDYTVIATFAGSQAYYTSSAATSFYAAEPAATAIPQATLAPTAADLYFIPAIVGLFVAIVICIAMVALVLRKHP